MGLFSKKKKNKNNDVRKEHSREQALYYENEVIRNAPDDDFVDEDISEMLIDSAFEETDIRSQNDSNDEDNSNCNDNYGIDIDSTFDENDLHENFDDIRTGDAERVASSDEMPMQNDKENIIEHGTDRIQEEDSNKTLKIDLSNIGNPFALKNDVSKNAEDAEDVNKNETDDEEQEPLDIDNMFLETHTDDSENFVADDNKKNDSDEYESNIENCSSNEQIDGLDDIFEQVLNDDKFFMNNDADDDDDDFIFGMNDNKQYGEISDIFSDTREELSECNNIENDEHAHHQNGNLLNNDDTDDTDSEYQAFDSVNETIDAKKFTSIDDCSSTLSDNKFDGEPNDVDNAALSYRTHDCYNAQEEEQLTEENSAIDKIDNWENAKSDINKKTIITLPDEQIGDMRHISNTGITWLTDVLDDTQEQETAQTIKQSNNDMIDDATVDGIILEQDVHQEDNKTSNSIADASLLLGDNAQESKNHETAQQNDTAMHDYDLATSTESAQKNDSEQDLAAENGIDAIDDNKAQDVLSGYGMKTEVAPKELISDNSDYKHESINAMPGNTLNIGTQRKETEQLKDKEIMNRQQQAVDGQEAEPSTPKQALGEQQNQTQRIDTAKTQDVELQPYDLRIAGILDDNDDQKARAIKQLADKQNAARAEKRDSNNSKKHCRTKASPAEASAEPNVTLVGAELAKNIVMPDEKRARAVAGFFANMQELERVEIAYALKYGKLRARDISKLMNVDAKLVTSTLKKMIGDGIVSTEKINNMTYYRLETEIINELLDMIDVFIQENGVETRLARKVKPLQKNSQKISNK